MDSKHMVMKVESRILELVPLVSYYGLKRGFIGIFYDILFLLHANARRKFHVGGPVPSTCGSVYENYILNHINLSQDISLPYMRIHRSLWSKLNVDYPRGIPVNACL